MRIKRGVTGVKKRRTVLKDAKSYRGKSSKNFRVAREAVMKAGQYAYEGRKMKKRDLRSIWIVRINAACRENDLSYNKFISGLKLQNIELDRKVLAQMALEDKAAFAALCEKIKTAPKAPKAVKAEAKV